MKTKMGRYDAAARTVPVTFTEGEVVHRRDVNACLDEAGAYDAAATKARVADVGRGVAVKIGLGLIVQPQEDPEAAPEPTPAA